VLRRLSAILRERLPNIDSQKVLPHRAERIANCRRFGSIS
jgi:hypothetical protein